ncbi:MAG: DUF1638 domain-containing protein [Rhizobiaceae bacterium]
MGDQPVHAPRRIRVIACGMIAREVLAVNEQLGLDHIDLKCLPAEFHHHPDRIAPAMDRAIIAARAEGYEHVFAGYADCGTGGALDKVLAIHGVERIAGPHCFSFYIGNDTFAREGEEHMMTFFITDFLARHFETFLIKPLGLDRHPELIPVYFGNYRKALYLAQTEDPQLDALAREGAGRLGLEYERRLTGYGDLTAALAELK